MTYQLLHGDCLDLLPTLEAGSVDAVITDPPYGTTACKWDSVIPFAPMWAELKRLIKPRGAIVLFGSQPFTSALVMSNPKWFRYEWVWEKDRATGFLDVQARPLKAHENILVFADSPPIYTPQMIDVGLAPNKRGPTHQTARLMYRPGLHNGGDRQETTRYPRSVQRFNTVNSAHGPVHPTQKPLALMEYLVKTYTNEGDTVLDFTMGSATTGEACINTGRDFIGIEKDAGYYSVAEQRLAEAAARLHQMELAV